MDRELVMAVLALLSAGPLFLVCGALTSSEVPRTSSARAWERHCWARLWLPLLPGGLALAILVGWALREPSSAEPVPGAMIGAMLPFLLIWSRTLGRAALCVAPPRRGVVAGTVGFVRPRVVLSEPLQRALRPSELAAAHAHEKAHVRHRDPLRLLLARLATDLQWPCPGAQARLGQWRRSLELARDEEARLEGADGRDLAAAILEGARLDLHRPAKYAPLGGGAVSLEERIGVLLSPLACDDERVAPSPTVPLALAGLGALGLGATFGETVVRVLLA